MAKVIVGLTISLDGFVADQNGNAGRLYPDLAALRGTVLLGGYNEIEGYGLGKVWVAGGVGGDLILVGSGWGVAEICAGSR